MWGRDLLLDFSFLADSCVHMTTKVNAVIRALTKNRGLMPPAFTPPKRVTSHAPSMGPAIPSRPAATVSQIVIPVARSSFARQFPQIVAQLWMLTEKPSQYATMAKTVMSQL